MASRSVIGRRRCLFAPYTPGGPVFVLRTWDCNEIDPQGKRILGYALESEGHVIFWGEDFHCSPLHDLASNECIRALMGFLTLRPGDTDAEYFAHYTPEQLAFCHEHAEALAFEVERRYPMRGE